MADSQIEWSNLPAFHILLFLYYFRAPLFTLSSVLSFMTVKSFQTHTSSILNISWTRMAPLRRVTSSSPSQQVKHRFALFLSVSLLLWWLPWLSLQHTTASSQHGPSGASLGLTAPWITPPFCSSGISHLLQAWWLLKSSTRSCQCNYVNGIHWHCLKYLLPSYTNTQVVLNESFCGSSTFPQHLLSTS